MAIVYLKNATVEKAFNGGRGYAISENFKKQDGSDGKSRYKAWFDTATPLAEGSTVDISGLLSAKVVEFEGQNGTVQIAEMSLNSARLNSEPVAGTPAGADPVF